MSHETADHVDRRRDADRRDGDDAPKRDHRGKERPSKSGKGRETIIDVRTNDAKGKNKRGYGAHSVLYRQTLHPEDMPTDHTRLKCMSIKTHGPEVQESLDLGTQRPVVGDTSSLVNIRDEKTLLSTLGGDITYTQVGTHKYYGCESAVNPNATISLFNTDDIEKLYSLQSVNMVTTGVIGATGSEKKTIAGLTFTRDAPPGPNDEGALLSVTFTKHTDGEHKSLFIRNKPRDIYHVAPKAKSGSTQVRADDSSDLSSSDPSDDESSDSDSDDRSVNYSDSYSDDEPASDESASDESTSDESASDESASDDDGRKRPYRPNYEASFNGRQSKSARLSSSSARSDHRARDDDPSDDGGHNERDRGHHRKSARRGGHHESRPDGSAGPY